MSLNNVPAAFDDIDGMDMTDETLKRLEQAFVEAQRSFRKSQDPEEEHAMTWLARRIDNLHAYRGDLARAPPFYQPATELVVDDYRELLLSALASIAVNDGRLDDAEGWLAQCDAHSEKLECDSAYRSTRASLEMARGRYEDALALLGDRLDEVPTPPEDTPAMGMKRVTALEAVGRREEAERTLVEVVDWVEAFQLANNGGDDAPDDVKEACRASDVEFCATMASKAEHAPAAAVWDRLNARDALPDRQAWADRAKQTRVEGESTGGEEKALEPAAPDAPAEGERPGEAGAAASSTTSPVVFAVVAVVSGVVLAIVMTQLR